MNGLAKNGKQLPAPPGKFGGKIERTTEGSKPYWPARTAPPEEASNVLLIITDDAGFGVPSTFGGVIPTPALDRTAANGLRFTSFHLTALWAPTRAALITWQNHHSAGCCLPWSCRIPPRMSVFTKFRGPGEWHTSRSSARPGQTEASIRLANG